jgi:tetratricopeptide (TPR) repeat protein
MGRTITSDVAQGFSITSDRKGVPAVPADMKAGELYSAGYSAYNANDYETAAAFWKRTAEIDPKMASAWSGLGFAYQKLKRYDAAIAAMEKQIELDPSNKRIHTDLGFVAKTAGKLDVAARAYSKHVELNPLDGEAHKTLGEIHLDREDYAAAIPVLEKAIALNKTDEWAHVFLGAAHLERGERESALAAFDRAAAMKGSPAVLTRIGWELASKGVHAEKATAFLDRAVKQIMESTATLAAGDITAAHIDLMTRLGWIWDARGMLALRKKDVDSAIRHFEAAWRLLDEVEIAEHLGEAYEAAPHRSADALNMYLTARALLRRDATRLDERIRRLAPNLDIEPLMKAARTEGTKQRSVVIAGDWGTKTRAELSAILDGSGKVIDAHWTSGDGQLRELPSKLIGRQFPIEAPGKESVRLATKLGAACTPPFGCAVFTLPAVEAR